MNELITSFSIEENSFERMYRYCAKKRSEIAKALHHAPIERFGSFREETFVSWEEFFSDPSVKQAWPEQQSEMFKHVLAIIPQFQDEDSYMLNGVSVKRHVDDFLEIDCIEVNEETKKVLPPEIQIDRGFVFKITIKSPKFERTVTGDHHNGNLSTIDLSHNPYNSRQDQMQISYAGTNKHDQKGDFKIADNYFKNLLKMDTDTKEGRTEFLKELGRLNHLMAHLLPVKRGNAGICEWIMRAIAFKKGIELGEFNREEVLSWDFKALVTPNREEYANWFATKAFLDIVIDSGPHPTSSLSL